MKTIIGIILWLLVVVAIYSFEHDYGFTDTVTSAAQAIWSVVLQMIHDIKNA